VSPAERPVDRSEIIDLGAADLANGIDWPDSA